MTLRRFYPPTVTILLIWLAVVAPLITRPFHTRGEAREAIIAQTMLNTGNYILPELTDGHIPAKPPVTHWLMLGASTFSSGELSPFICRLPGAVLGLLLALYLFYTLKKQETPQQIAVLAPCMLLLSFEFSRALTSSRTDIIFASFLSMAWLAYFNHHKYFVPLLLAAATLAKGPAALILFPGAIFIYLLVSKNLSIRKIGYLILCNIFATCIAAIWYFAAYEIAGDKFIQLVLEENFRRFTGTMHEPVHKHGFWYLVGSLLLGILPWNLWLITQAKILRTKFALSQDLLFFCSTITITVFVFFAIPSSKRSVYLLPLYPFAVTLLASYISWRAVKIYAATCFIISAAILHPLVVTRLSPVSFAKEIRPLIQADAMLYAYKKELFSLSYYLKQPIHDLHTPEELGKLTSGYIFAKHTDMLPQDKFALIAESAHGIDKINSRVKVYKIKEDAPPNPLDTALPVRPSPNHDS